MSDHPGKPRKDTRFKPGRSGNPKGRPKGQSSTRSDDEFLDGLIKVPIHGRMRRLPRRVLLQEKTFGLAMQGNIAALKHLQKVAKEDTKAAVNAALAKHKEEAAAERDSSAAEVRRKIEEMAERHRQESDDGDDE